MSLLDRMIKEQTMGMAMASSDPSTQAFFQGKLNRIEMKEQMDRLIAAQNASAASSQELAETKAALDESMKAVRHLREQLQIANKTCKWEDGEAHAAYSVAREYGAALGKSRDEVTETIHQRRDAYLIENGHGALINDTSFRE